MTAVLDAALSKLYEEECPLDGSKLTLNVEYDESEHGWYLCAAQRHRWPVTRVHYEWDTNFCEVEFDEDAIGDTLDNYGC